MQSNYNSHVLLAGMQNGLATLENSLAVSYKAKYTLSVWPNTPTFSYLSKRNHQKNLYANTYSSFIHNCPKLETTQMAFKERLNKLWYIHTTEHYSAIKRMNYYKYNNLYENQRHYAKWKKQLKG